MAANPSDNHINGLLGVVKDALEAAFNKGVEHGKRIALAEMESKIRDSTPEHSCRLCCMKEVVK